MIEITDHQDFPEGAGPQHVLAQVLAWIDYDKERVTSVNEAQMQEIQNKLIEAKFNKKDVEDAIDHILKKAKEGFQWTRGEIADQLLWDKAGLNLKQKVSNPGQGQAK